MRRPYPGDLTDAQWEIIEPLLPPWVSDPRGGRPREADLREVLNTIFYLERSGCQWDMLPHDLMAKSTAHDYYARWRGDGTWGAINDALRPRVRVAAGREPTPSAAIIDSRTVKAAEVGGARGYDGGKKVRGRKRHVVVDSMGLLMAVPVTAASADDGTTAPRVLDRLDRDSYPRLEVVRGDTKYRNDGLEGYLVANGVPYRFEVVARRPEATGFEPVPGRWPVERTFAWLGRSRRHARDYEWSTESSEAMIRVSMIHLMLRRLAPDDSRTTPFKYPGKHQEKVPG
jgi:putative transposase